MPGKPCDDVIRIRIDAAAAVQDFLAVLAAQAEEGETRAPAKPANRAVYRELAPFRLVEFDYINGGLGGVEGAYIGFPDGNLFAVAEEIPEEAVDWLVEGDPARLEPLYVYVALAQPASEATIDGYLAALAGHLGRSVVGVVRGEGGVMVGRSFGGGNAAEVAKIAEETDRLFTKAQLLERFALRTRASDGVAYAQFATDFSAHLLAFPSAAERDDFVLWTRKLCTWIYAHPLSAESAGFKDVFRPACEVSAPAGDVAVVDGIEAPKAYRGGRPWTAFEASASDQKAMELVRDYWTHVKHTIARSAAAKPR